MNAILLKNISFVYVYNMRDFFYLYQLKVLSWVSLIKPFTTFNYAFKSYPIQPVNPPIQPNETCWRIPLTRPHPSAQFDPTRFAIPTFCKACTNTDLNRIQVISETDHKLIRVDIWDLILKPNEVRLNLVGSDWFIRFVPVYETIENLSNTILSAHM